MAKKGREEEEDLTKISTPYDEFQYWLSTSEQYQLKPVYFSSIPLSPNVFN